MIPERNRNTLFAFSGDEINGGEMLLNENDALWSMRLFPRSLWTGSNSINDVKRVMHKGRVHIIVCGNGGDGKYYFCQENSLCSFIHSHMYQP